MSLVGSEMCIRDTKLAKQQEKEAAKAKDKQDREEERRRRDEQIKSMAARRAEHCLLYTSDAADEL